jgi:hypothetical protein
MNDREERGHNAEFQSNKTRRAQDLGRPRLASAAYLASAHFAGQPVASVTILLVGRALLGVTESFVITGALRWGVALAGSQNTGKVMWWVGTALYSAFAVGASPTTALTHIAVQEQLDGKNVEWMEQVSDEEDRSSRNAGSPGYTM